MVLPLEQNVQLFTISFLLFYLKTETKYFTIQQEELDTWNAIHRSAEIHTVSRVKTICSLVVQPSLENHFINLLASAQQSSR